ncbi:hypothetical protein AWB94_17345 [Mycolicibacterium canariasense]|nr:hypothetical protein AWB94_17345 [Mycolicibacterium canariasense]
MPSESEQTSEEHAGTDFDRQWDALAALVSPLKDVDLPSLAVVAIGVASLGLADLATTVSDLRS